MDKINTINSLYLDFLALSSKEKEQFLRILRAEFPHFYNFATMTLSERKVFTRETVITPYLKY